MPFATTWTDLEGIMLGDMSQTEKDKYHMISFDIIIKNNTNISIYKAETDSQTENKCIVTKGEREWGGIN